MGGCVDFSVNIFSSDECELAAGFLSVPFSYAVSAACIQNGGDKECTCIYKQHGIDPYISLNTGANEQTRVCKLSCEGSVNPTSQEHATATRVQTTTTITTTMTTTTACQGDSSTRDVGHVGCTTYSSGGK